MAKSKFDSQKHHRHSIRLPHYDYAQSGAFVVMPNHFHGILIFQEHVGATRHGRNKMHASNESSSKEITDSIVGSPLPHGLSPASLGAIIAQFKSRVPKRL